MSIYDIKQMPFVIYTNTHQYRKTTMPILDAISIFIILSSWFFFNHFKFWWISTATITTLFIHIIYNYCFLINRNIYRQNDTIASFKQNEINFFFQMMSLLNPKKRISGLIKPILLLFCNYDHFVCSRIIRWFFLKIKWNHCFFFITIL